MLSDICLPTLLAQVIDFGESLDVTPISGTEQDELSCNWDDIPLNSDNLVIKVPLSPLSGTPSCRIDTQGTGKKRSKPQFCVLFCAH